MDGPQSVMHGWTAECYAWMDRRVLCMDGPQSVMHGWTAECYAWMDGKVLCMDGLQSVMHGWTAECYAWMDRRVLCTDGPQSIWRTSVALYHRLCRCFANKLEHSTFLVDVTVPKIRVWPSRSSAQLRKTNIFAQDKYTRIYILVHLQVLNCV
jgi:hypothetical protein